MKKAKSSAPKGAGPEPKKRRRLGTAVKVVMAVGVISAVLAVGLWGMWGGTGYLTVGDVLGNVGKYMDKYIEVRGTVKSLSLDSINKTFVLTDKSAELKVNYTGALPSNFEEGKDVVVKGTLRSGGGIFVVAKEIVVGCASKY
jgi:cytochrome c-type biogenesis protein CcmE